MNKIGCPTYLSNDKVSLRVEEAGIEGGHFLNLDSNYILSICRVSSRLSSSGVAIMTF